MCRQSLTKHAVAAVLALSLSASPSLAAPSGSARGASAASAVVSADSASSSIDASDNTTPIYFGNGCFWGRQKDFVDVEKALGREGGKISAITGYAGGAKGAGTALPVQGITFLSGAILLAKQIVQAAFWPLLWWSWLCSLCLDS